MRATRIQLRDSWQKYNDIMSIRAFVIGWRYVEKAAINFISMFKDMGEKH